MPSRAGASSVNRMQEQHAAAPWPWYGPPWWNHGARGSGLPWRSTVLFTAFLLVATAAEISRREERERRGPGSDS